MGGKANDIKITAFYMFNAYQSYPFLDPVSSGFIEGSELIDVISDLLFREFAEFHTGGAVDDLYILGRPETDRGNDLMGLIA